YCAQDDPAGAADQFAISRYRCFSCWRAEGYLLDVPSRRDASGEHQQQTIRSASDEVGRQYAKRIGLHRSAPPRAGHTETCLAGEVYIPVRFLIRETC